jgi:excisionase family DNA binding protein
MTHSPNPQPEPDETPRWWSAASPEGSERPRLHPIGLQDRLVLTVGEAAELLGISRAFAYELVARGELPVIRLGRRRLVPKLALRTLVDGEHGGDPAKHTA